MTEKILQKLNKPLSYADTLTHPQIYMYQYWWPFMLFPTKCIELSDISNAEQLFHISQIEGLQK